MRKISVCLSVCLLLEINTAAQVPSNIYSEESKVFDLYPQFGKLRASVPEIIMPGFDINRLLEEDEAVKGKDVPYRFGKGFDVNYSIADGIWTKVDNGNVWLMKVTSPGAYSINFIFNELFLPESAELYIYSYDGSMVYGPVTSKQNMERGLFLTDIVKGESVILYLYVPENKEVSTRLVISKIVHGYKDSFAGLFEAGKGLSDSEDCEKDVACYSGWTNESNAVALVLLASGEEHCSGSLLNNTARNFRAYFLTAFHAVDCSPQDGTISPAEEYNAEHWAFRFNYKKTVCDGSQIASYFTYNNDDVRAAWRTTDFALVELHNSPLAHQNVSFLGWDNTGATPTYARCIHHPQGDVMKISFDNDQLVETAPGQNSGSYFWRVRWDIGITEGGSSGAPLFDHNKRVIGQLAGGNSECEGSDMRDWFGCLYWSWTEGGTETTRLIDWLDPCETGASTINTLPGAYVSGPDIVCTSNSTFTLQNCPSGKTVTWSANPSYITPSSGSGLSATIHATCSGMGRTKITFTISDACGSSPVEREFLAAGPDYSEVKLNVTYSDGRPAPKPGGQFLLCPYTYYYFYAVNNSICSTSGYQWTLPPSITLVYTYNNMACVYTNNSNPGGNVRVKATTCCSGCGPNMLILSDYVGKYPYCGSGYMSFTPDPADDETILELQSDNIENFYEGNEWDLEIFNQQSLLMHKAIDLRENKYTINTSGWQEGIYFVRVIIKDKVLYGKFIVAR